MVSVIVYSYFYTNVFIPTKVTRLLYMNKNEYISMILISLSNTEHSYLY